MSKSTLTELLTGSSSCQLMLPPIIIYQPLVMMFIILKEGEEEKNGHHLNYSILKIKKNLIWAISGDMRFHLITRK